MPAHALKRKQTPKLKRRMSLALFPFRPERGRCYLNAIRAMLYLIRYKYCRYEEVTYHEGWLRKHGQPTVNHGWLEVRTKEEWSLIDPSRHFFDPLPQLENYVDGYTYTYAQVIDTLLQAAKFARLINLPLTPESTYKTKPPKA